MMHTIPHRRARPAIILLFVALLLAALLLPYPLLASGPLQNGSPTSVDIADRECTFWLDADGDGQGDETIDAGPDHYARQETAVVGGCTFRLNTDAAATLVVKSELDDWQSEVKIIRNPGAPETKTLYPAQPEIPGLQGSMEISIDHQGVTPRSEKNRTLRDNYNHAVQTPRHFRLLEVTVTTPDGISDRLEQSVQSASSAYIETHRRISGSNPDDSPAAALAAKLLAEGYPQVADRVLQLTDAPVAGTNWWMWATIAIASALVLAGGGVGIMSLRHRSSVPDSSPPTGPPSSGRNQM